MAGIQSIQNGKRGGRPKGRVAKSTLEANAIKTLYVDQAKLHALPILGALVKKAKKGDVMAIKEFNDRVFGKANQPFEDKTPHNPDKKAMEIAMLIVEKYITKNK